MRWAVTAKVEAFKTRPNRLTLVFGRVKPGISWRGLEWNGYRTYRCAGTNERINLVWLSDNTRWAGPYEILSEPPSSADVRKAISKLVACKDLSPQASIRALRALPVMLDLDNPGLLVPTDLDAIMHHTNKETTK